MPQSLGTGGPRARNVRPFLRGTGNPHFWITESRIARSLNAKAHPHRARPIGCSGQQRLFNASVGMVLVPLPSCSKDPCPWSNGRPRLDGLPTTRDGQPPTRAPLGRTQPKWPLSGVQAQAHVPMEPEDVPITGNRRTKVQECASFPKRNWESPLLDH